MQFDRLRVGRKGLASGEQALSSGRLDEARACFQGALDAFRSPELRLGEAHSLRGLALVDIAAGRAAVAEGRLREAIQSYQAVHPLIDRLDPSALFRHDLRREAFEGELAAMVAFGELVASAGRLDEARLALEFAERLCQDLPELRSAGAVWASAGRQAMRDGDLARSRMFFERFRHACEERGDIAGQAAAWLEIAELERVERNGGAAEAALEKARALASGEAAGPRLEGRVLAARAAIHLQDGRTDEAKAGYAAALQAAAAAMDRETEAFALLGLGEAESRAGVDAGRAFEAARMFVGMRHRHGFALSLQRIAEHACRRGSFDLALVASEIARRGFAVTDPVRGCGQAWRILVKSLAHAGEPEEVLAAALAREALVGKTQPNAAAVAAFYRERESESVVRALASLSPRDLLARAEAAVARHVEHVSKGLDIELGTLGSDAEALAAVEGLAARTTARDAATDETALAVLVGADEDDLPLVLTADRAGHPSIGEAMSKPNEPEDSDFIAELPLDAIEPLTDEVPLPVRSDAASSYDAFYDPPAEVGAATDALDEEAVPVPEELKQAPPPAEYADFYDPPGADDIRSTD